MEDRIEACKTLLGKQLSATKGRDLFTRQEVIDSLLDLWTVLHLTDEDVPSLQENEAGIGVLSK